MKKNLFLFLLLFALYGNRTFATEIKTLAVNKTQDINIKDISTKQHNETQHQNFNQFSDLERQIRGDFRLFLQELYTERERGKKEAAVITKNMTDILSETAKLIEESRSEIREMSYKESRNLLIASVFLWISITIFIIINLIFANNLKKELYFLRNGLLRSEIKENMIALLNQLSILNEKLDSINRS